MCTRAEVSQTYIGNITIREESGATSHDGERDELSFFLEGSLSIDGDRVSSNGVPRRGFITLLAPKVEHGGKYIGRLVAARLCRCHWS